MLAMPNRLGEIRETLGLSQAAIAKHLGVHESTVSRWEADISQIPDERKQQLAELLGVSVSFLMRWDEPNGNGHNGEEQVA